MYRIGARFRSEADRAAAGLTILGLEAARIDGKLGNRLHRRCKERRLRSAGLPIGID